MPTITRSRGIPFGLGTAALAVTATAASLAVLPASGAGAEARVVKTTLVSDEMNRTVHHGLGRARVGGYYVVSAPRQSAVVNGAGRVRAVAPGRSFSARLTSARGRDVDLAGTFRINRLPRRGSVYVELVLRRQANGDALRAYVRVLPRGRALVGLAFVHNGRDHRIGGEIALRSRVVAGREFAVGAAVRGKLVVRAAVRAWTGRRIPGWQRTVTVRVPSSISDAGAVGIYNYVSARGRSTSLTIERFRGAVYRIVGASSTPSRSPSSPTTPQSTPTDPPPSTEPPVPNTPGAAPLGSTSYPIPGNAVYVSPDGSDAGPGTLANPMRTLTGAVARATSDTTVVLRAGTYHESVSIPVNKRLTVQSYPGDVVWLDGSTPVSDWTQSGSTFVHSGWTSSFSSDLDKSFINPSYPMANHPDQMWLDGAELRQVSSAAAVTPTSFYVDEDRDQLVIGTNPAGRTVRASDLSTGLTLKAVGSVVRGIGVRRYANNLKDLGALRLYGTNSLAENVLVTENAYNGIVVPYADITLRHVSVTDNGLLGVAGNNADRVTLDSVLARGNNSEHFNRAPVSGGVKITRARGLTIRNSDFSANDGPGLWLDESCYDAMIAGNRMSDNLGHGLSYEISDTALIVNNVVTDNGGVGFKINNSGNVRMWNNTLGGNARAVWLVQDSRRGSRASDPGHDMRQPQPDASMPWIVRSTVMANNLFLAPARGTFAVSVIDASKEYAGRDMVALMNGNRFVRTNDTYLIEWNPTPGTVTRFTAIEQYTSATGDGNRNTEVASTAYRPPVGRDGSALPLPADVAAQAGQAAGTQQVGAF